MINKNIYTVLGGIHATVLHEEILKCVNSIDAIVRGEGEETLYELITMLNNNGISCNFNKIKGISYRKDNHIEINPDSPFIENLDSLPFFYYPFIDMKKVQCSFPDTLPIYTGRGCCFSCRFCAEVGMWKRNYKQKSAERIFEELRF